MTVTDHSTAPCTIDGYPDAALTSSSGPAVLAYQAGRANALLPVPAMPRPVTLVYGASASATLATAVPDQRGSQCHTWSALSIGPPRGSRHPPPQSALPGLRCSPGRGCVRLGVTREKQGTFQTSPDGMPRP